MANHAALPTHAIGGRGSADAVDPRARQQVWAFRIPADHGAAEARRMASGQGSCAAHLAAGRLEGPRQTETARTVVAQRWKLHPSAADTSQPRVELRFRGRHYARRTQPAIAGDDRRVHARMLSDPRGAASEQ